ncbi:MAG: nucleotidyltransferase family protein [Candidatus Doudnabacteria bacterium]|nr:nucleotidyltransferase family protein [Candidatus Doudnabacteria bacterium]
MTSKDIVEIYNKADKAGIKFWIDGGWCVDALLGQQTREHKDLDIAINADDLASFLKLAQAQGFKLSGMDGEYNFVLRDDKAREIDVHAFITNKKGNVVGGIKYPKQSLTGKAKFEGQTVRCIAPEYMVQFIVPWAYKHKEKYKQDLKALCDKFGIDYPTVLKELL